MRFQISETIYTADLQKVRRLLERCLCELAAEVAIDATASHDEVVLHGLGASPVSINPRDIAVFRIRSETDKTIVDGDVTFQASSMLGDLAQDNVVRSKLEGVFEKLRMQIDSEARKPTALLETTVLAVPADIATPDENTKPTAALPEDTSEPLSAPAFPSEHSPEHRAVEPVEHGTTIHRKRANAFIAALALSLLLIGAALLYLRDKKTNTFFAANMPPTVAATPAISRPTPKKEQPGNNLGAVNTGPASPQSSNDLNLWIDSWEAAMRSRDAVAQSSFYANTADRHHEPQDLSSESVLKNLEADIRMRNGLWTVKMEDVVIERHTNTEAEIRLVKHIIEEPSPHKILESFVPARLILEREKGMWKIFSEQDSPSSSVTPEQSR